MEREGFKMRGERRNRSGSGLEDGDCDKGNEDAEKLIFSLVYVCD